MPNSQNNLDLKVLAQEPEPAAKQPESQQSAVRSFERINSNLVLYGRWLLNSMIMVLGDIFGLITCLVSASALRAYLFGEPMLPEWSWFLLMVWLIAAIGVRLVPGWGLGPVEELRRIMLLLVGVFAATTTAVFLAKMQTVTSRLTLSLSFLLCLPVLPLMRYLCKNLVMKLNIWGMQTVIYSDAETAHQVIKSLREEPGLGYIPIAVCVDQVKEGDPDEIEGVPIYAMSSEHELFAHVAILAKPQLPRQDLLTYLEGPLSRYRHIVMIPDLQEAPSLWVKPRDMGGVLGLEISSNLLDTWARMLKRIVDMVIIIVLSPLWVPVFLLLTLLIWLQDFKNPFFIHTRAGQSGKDFKIWKFRTMRHDAESYLEEKLEEDEDLRIEWETNFKLRNDPRITWMGRFLRRTSLDEIPQLLNVFVGDMSLVGPRPLPKYHNDELPDRIRDMRERVRPGMTGLWQVSGRSSTGNEGIAKWDTYYVRNWSFWLDVVILFRTIRAVTRKDGAY